MFPLRAVHKPQHTPWITRLLIVLNLLAFVAQWWPGEQGNMLRATADSWMVRPSCYFAPSGCGIEVPGEVDLLWKPLFGSLFLHAGLLHLAFNMLFLWVFGAGVEDKLGRLNFLAFYLTCGIGATLFYIATHPLSNIPLVGASGAISGVLGAYFILQTRAWILTYFPPIFLFPVPAPLFLALWFAAQLASQFSTAWNRVLATPGSQGDGIAWMAHIGGFLIGVFWGWIVRPWWKKRKVPVKR